MNNVFLIYNMPPTGYVSRASPSIYHVYSWNVFNGLYQGSLISALLMFEVVYFTYKLVPKRVRNFLTDKIVALDKK